MALRHIVQQYDGELGIFRIALMLAVNTSHIAFSQEQSQLSLKIDYLLEANYEPVADCTLELHVTEKDASLFSLEQ